MPETVDPAPDASSDPFAGRPKKSDPPEAGYPYGTRRCATAEHLPSGATPKSARRLRSGTDAIMTAAQRTERLPAMVGIVTPREQQAL
jgi:hypothetical protein